MTRRTLALALLAGALSPLPCAAAGQQDIRTTNVRIARAAGRCPSTIGVRIATRGWEGGAAVDVAAEISTVATVSELISATPSRVEFRADLRPAFASCEGTGRSPNGEHAFTLRGGRLTYVLRPGEGANATPPVLLDINVENGPRVKMALSD